MQTPSFDLILVSDDSLLARTVQLAVADRGSVVIAQDVAQAERLLRRAPSVRAIVLDANVAQRAVADASRIRAIAPLAPLLVIASKLVPDLLNGLQPLRAQILVRPLPTDGISTFVERALAAGRVEHVAIENWIEHFADEHRLTHNDLGLLPLVLDEESPEDACERLGIDRAALDRGLRRLVKKCRVRNIDRLARNLIRDAYLYRSALTAELIEPAQAASF